MMDAITALGQLQQAKVNADIQFASDVQAAVTAYVQAAEANAQASRAWLPNVTDDTLASAAQATWQQLAQARQALGTALAAARSARAQTLADAWAAVKAA